MDTNGNAVINQPQLTNSKINFSGSNNILYFQSEQTRLENSTINFSGDNSVVIIMHSSAPLKFSITAYNQSVIFVGEDCSMNNKLELIASEGKNIVIGREGLFSSQCLVRTGDAHRIYSIESMQRLNEGRSVYIGDHVWAGARAVILKGTQIHSGSVIGCDSVVAGKCVLSNSVWAGNPAREIRSGVFFDKSGTHGLYGQTIERARTADAGRARNYIFENDGTYVPFEQIESALAAEESPSARLEIMLGIMQKGSRNRFALR